MSGDIKVKQSANQEQIHKKSSFQQLSNVEKDSFYHSHLQHQKSHELIERQLSCQDNNSEYQKQNTEHLSDAARFKWLLKSCFEEATSFLMEWAPSTVILYFVTQNNNQLDVSGFGLGLVWSNCIGQGLQYGLCNGFETMASHAHGKKNYQLVGNLFNKTLLVSAILFIPIMLSMIFSENILLLWNKDQNLCYVASQYCIMSIPGLFLAALYYALKAFLNAQNEFRVQVYTAGANLILVFLYSYIFIQYFHLGVKGAAIVFILSEATCLYVLSLFIYFKKNLHKCLTSFSKEVFKDLMEYLSVAVPIGSIVAAQWIVYELNSILSSNLKSDQYFAHIVLANFCAMCFQFQIGYSTASATFIGNEMGRPNVKNALKYTKYALIILTVHLSIVVIPLIFLRKQIAEIFTIEPDVESSLLSVYFIFLTFFILESYSSITSAYMRAIAQENYSSVCYFICYGGIGFITSYLLAYQANYGLKGIWFGMITACSCYLLLLLIQICRVDINEMALIIAERVKEEEEQDEQEVKQQLAIQNQDNHNEDLNYSG